MNAKKLCAAFAAIMAVATALLLFSCGVDPMQNVSERRDAYYTGGDGAFTVTAVSGVREEPFSPDGAAGQLVPYTLMTVVPQKFDMDAIYTYTARTDCGEYGGTLILHPFAASYSAEFRAETHGDITVRIMAGGEAHEYALTSLVAPDTISYAQAIAAAKNEIDMPADCELRVRLIKNPIGGEGMCWHVSAIAPDGRETGVLMDAVSAKVLAKKPA